MACVQVVQVWKDGKGQTYGFTLVCSQKCNAADTDECAEKERTGATGATSYAEYYCACDGGKGKQAGGCQIVLRRDRATKEMKYDCDGNDCKEGEECKADEVPGTTRDVAIPDKDGKYRGKHGKVTDYVCRCQPTKKQ